MRMLGLLIAILLTTGSIEAQSSKLLFVGCGGLCVMDPEPGAVPVSLPLEFPETVDFYDDWYDSVFVIPKWDELPVDVSWSPDGTLIALKTSWGHSGQNSIYTLSSDGTGLREVVSQPCCEGAERRNSDRTQHQPIECCGDHIPSFFRSGIAWSPDGSELAYVHVDGHIEVYFSHGVLSRRFTTQLSTDAWPSIDWTSDGIIYFSSSFDGKIYTLHSDGSGIDSLSISGSDFEVSPDGETLAYTTGDYPDRQIFLLNVGNGATTYLTDGHGPEWSPDSRQIAFFHNREIVIINQDGSGKQTVYEGSGWAIDWSPWLDTPTGIAPASWGEVKYEQNY